MRTSTARSAWCSITTGSCPGPCQRSGGRHRQRLGAVRRDNRSVGHALDLHRCARGNHLRIVGKQLRHHAHGAGCGHVRGDQLRPRADCFGSDVWRNRDLAAAWRSRLGGSSGGTGFFELRPSQLRPSLATEPTLATPASASRAGPGQLNFDMSLVKTTRVGGIREDARPADSALSSITSLTTRNSTIRALPSLRATFGVITSTSVNPRLIQFAMKYIF